MQGNWIVNSELIYVKDTVSSYNGIPAELMCRARDYVVSMVYLKYLKDIYQNVLRTDGFSYYRSPNTSTYIEKQLHPLLNCILMKLRKYLQT